MAINTINDVMSRSIPWADRFAIGISTLCLVHCLAMPLILTVLPSLGVSFVADEKFHAWLVYIVIPTSVIALSVGCKQHKRGAIVIFGLCGLSLLIAALNVEAMGLDHDWEQILTVMGTFLIAFAHIRNFTLCQDPKKECEC